MLSIKEAAKVIGVSQNTLRNWDSRGKLKSVRTAGGHRRYPMSIITAYLNDKSDSEIKMEEIPSVELTEPEEYSIDRREKQALAILLQNYCIYDKLHSNLHFSRSQALYLIRVIWKRLKFKRLISMQPLLFQSGLVFFKNNKTITSKKLVTRHHLYKFKLFTDIDFDTIKDSYAKAMAYEIDALILSNIPKHNVNHLTGKEITSLMENYDYFVGPSQMAQKININKDVIEHDGLDFAFVGRYPNLMDAPILCPYLLFCEGAHLTSNTKSIGMKIGWLNNV